MGIKARKRWQIGPRWFGVSVNATQRGFSSWGWRIGPRWLALSWNNRNRAFRVDLPGPLFWQGKGKRGRAARKAPPATPSRSRHGRPGGGGRPPPTGGSPIQPMLLTAALLGLVSRGGKYVEAGRARGIGWLDQRGEDRELPRDERILERQFRRRGRRDLRSRGVRLVCYGHARPLRFGTARAFREHLELCGAGARRAPVAPPNRPSGRHRQRPPTRPEQLDQKAAQWRPNIDKYRGKVGTVSEIGSLRELGESAPGGVEELRERLATLERFGQDLQEAMDGILLTWTRGANLSEEVLNELRPLGEAGEAITSAATRTLASFEERYGTDIRDAQAGQRPENEFLTR